MNNAADRKSIRRLEKQAKLADANRRAVITSLMSTAFGREWMWDVLAQCHCFATTFNGDALQSAFMEGQRAIGLAIISDIMLACPDQYIQAMRESNERSSLDERRSSPESDGRDSGSVDGDPVLVPDYDDTRPGAVNYDPYA
jgi:hypothetical protein